MVEGLEAISLGKVYNGFAMWASTTQEKAANNIMDSSLNSKQSQSFNGFELGLK